MKLGQPWFQGLGSNPSSFPHSIVSSWAPSSLEKSAVIRYDRRWMLLLALILFIILFSHIHPLRWWSSAVFLSVDWSVVCLAAWMLPSLSYLASPHMSWLSHCGMSDCSFVVSIQMIPWTKSADWHLIHSGFPPSFSRRKLKNIWELRLWVNGRVLRAIVGPYWR